MSQIFPQNNKQTNNRNFKQNKRKNIQQGKRQNKNNIMNNLDSNKKK